jgi:hypothetical protein
MVRFYESTWLIHHHAARSNYTYKAGLNVFGQISRFITDSNRFSSMHMDYVICFYRPENHFPKSVFGGVCRSINDPRKCSESVFAYVHLHCDRNGVEGTLFDHCLFPADDDDLRELSSFCRTRSGGLMVSALALEPGDADCSDLIDEFAKLGLKRERRLYALKRNDRLEALAMVNVADIGLNLSDLTSSITLFVLESKELTHELIQNALSVLMQGFHQEEIPVLIFPEAAAENLKMPVEKRYVMWSLMPRFSDDFNRHTYAIRREGRRNRDPQDEQRTPSV